MLISIWFVLGPIYISYIILILWDYSLVTLVWVLPLPIASYIFFTFKTVINYTIFLFVYILTLALITNYIDFSSYYFFTPEQIKIIDLLAIISFIFVMILILYYSNKILMVRIDIRNKANIKPLHSKPKTEELFKYNELFKQINLYMEEAEPFKNPDFSISELASSLNSNYSYISKSIKYNGFSNFNNFINSYRIEYVKKLLLDEKYNHFTLIYVYTEAGFTHQSTFNRVFREFVGVTPSQYIADLKRNDNKTDA